MISRDNPIFGRKVFFVNPPMGFESSVLKKLRDLEYEAYVVQDFRYIKSVLRHHEDALCFICIDSVLSVKEWYNFIKSFRVEDSLKSIFIGVLSGYANTGERGKFLINLQLPGGFIQLNQDTDDLVKQLVGILEINGAKGRRQYIRFICTDLPDINGYMAIGSNLFAFRIDNISSVGFACSYNPMKISDFPKNSVCNNISLTIGKKSITTPAVVFDTRLQDNMGTSVMLFTKEFPAVNKSVIRNYIFLQLDANLKKSIHQAMPDYTDYTVDIKLDDVPEYEIPEEKPLEKIGDVDIPKPDDANVEDAEEIEEIDEVNENVAPEAASESDTASEPTNESESGAEPEAK